MGKNGSLAQMVAYIKNNLELSLPTFAIKYFNVVNMVTIPLIKYLKTKVDIYYLNFWDKLKILEFNSILLSNIVGMIAD